MAQGSESRLKYLWNKHRSSIVTGAAVFAAVGTVAAAVFSLVQINENRSAHRQSELDAVQREIAHQAEQVAAWPVATNSSGFPVTHTSHGDVTYVDLSNTSSEPVYSAVVTLTFVQGAGPHNGVAMSRFWEREHQPDLEQRTLLDIPPGRSRTSVSGDWPARGLRAGIEIAFTDQAGRSWVREADGQLREITKSPTDYYGLHGPYEDAAPEP